VSGASTRARCCNPSHDPVEGKKRRGGNVVPVKERKGEKVAPRRGEVTRPSAKAKEGKRPSYSAWSKHGEGEKNDGFFPRGKSSYDG